jgi:GNAT superfamily N-acetyltransferase
MEALTVSDITITLRARSDLSPTERAEVDALFAAAFADGVDDLAWATSEWYVLVRDLDGVLTSMIEILERTVTVDSQPVRVGGIGGVGTHPDYRRLGHSTAALRVAADFLRENLAVPFGLLVTGEEEIPFYGRLGWRVIAGAVTFDQPGDRIFVSDGVNMVLPLGPDPWPSGPVHLCGLPW